MLKQVCLFGRTLFRVSLIVLICGATAMAGTGGSISGTVKDPTGAVVPSAQVVLTETSTGVQRTSVTDARGAYSFQAVPVGHYKLEVVSTGFKQYRRSSIVLDANSALQVDAALEAV